MFWLKACPQCRGDLYEKKDHYGWYIACLQCGYQLSVDEEELALESHSVRNHPRLPKFKSSDRMDLPVEAGPYRHRKWRDSPRRRR
jgi:DNA-directed RNA polymerase subunit M/transcription elongation factor TFIIS